MDPRSQPATLPPSAEEYDLVFKAYMRLHPECSEEEVRCIFEGLNARGLYLLGLGVGRALGRRERGWPD